MTILDCIGHTPLVTLNSNLHIKLEYMNPFGSFKDRVALAMLKDVPEGTTIVEVSTGNTAISLAFVAQIRKLKTLFLIPKTVSPRKLALLKLAGATIKLHDSMYDCIQDIRNYTSQDGFVYTKQFGNQLNVDAHYNTTGPEVWEQTKGRVSSFVCGVGSAGLIIGVGRYLKRKDPRIKIVAVEPDFDANLSSLLRETHMSNSGKIHKIEGTGTGFIPENFDRKVVDDIITVTDQQAMQCQYKYMKQGVLGGISTGANLFAAEQITGDCIVTVACDATERYDI